jgi:hypothetical protein
MIPSLLDSPRARRWQAWLERMGHGDLDACGAFYDESAPLAFGLLLQIVRDRTVAEEALLDLYVDIQRRAERREHYGRNPVAWLVLLARDVAATRASHIPTPYSGTLVAFESAGCGAANG